MLTTEHMYRAFCPALAFVAAKMGGDNRAFPREFNTALANAMSVGFVFGSDGGGRQGAYATGPARFTVLAFRIDS